MNFSETHFIITGCLPASSEIFKAANSKALTPTSLLGSTQDSENKTKASVFPSKPWPRFSFCQPGRIGESVNTNTAFSSVSVPRAGTLRQLKSMDFGINVPGSQRGSGVCLLWDLTLSEPLFCQVSSVIPTWNWPCLDGERWCNQSQDTERLSSHAANRSHRYCCSCQGREEGFWTWGQNLVLLLVVLRVSFCDWIKSQSPSPHLKDENRGTCRRIKQEFWPCSAS